MEPNAPSPGGQGPEAGPKLPSIELPNTQPETGGYEAAPQPAAPEVDRAQGEAANQNQGMSLPIPVHTPAPLPLPQADDTTSKGTQTAGLQAPDFADDVDVIEKEWVDKAKEIVAQAKEDPYRQNHNVSVLKADYMKKRYGKEIKIPDDKPTKA